MLSHVKGRNLRDKIREIWEFTFENGPMTTFRGENFQKKSKREILFYFILEINFHE